MKDTVLAVLIVEDEVDERQMLDEAIDEALEGIPFDKVLRADRAGALKAIEEHFFDIVVTDLRLDSIGNSGWVDGWIVTSTAIARDKRTKVVCVTSRLKQEDAEVVALHLGAEALFERRADNRWAGEFKKTIRQLAEEARKGRRELGLYALPEVDQKLDLVKDSRSPVLFYGQIGTGKSSYVRKLAAMSGQRVKHVNCAALAEGNALLLTLFGSLPDIFAGVGDLPGIFEMVDDRWIVFLDEVGRLSPEAQGALLQVLEERKFQRAPFNDLYLLPKDQQQNKSLRERAAQAVKTLYPRAPAQYKTGDYGYNEPRDVRCRLVFATNQNLAALVRGGTLLPDLYSRLMAFAIEVPPLEKRRQDISGLARKFVAESSDAKRKGIQGLSDKAIELLLGHNWPVNVRELIHTLEAAVLRAQGSTIEPEDIKFFQWIGDPQRLAPFETGPAGP